MKYLFGKEMMHCPNYHMLNNFEINPIAFDFGKIVSRGTEHISFSFQGKPLIT